MPSFSPSPSSHSNQVDVVELRRNLQTEEKRIRNKGLIEFYELRKQWSIYLITLLFFIIPFETALTLGVGLNLLNFLNYKWFLSIVLIETLAKIIGMGYIVVGFLFDKQKQDYSDRN